MRPPAVRARPGRRLAVEQVGGHAHGAVDVALRVEQAREAGRVGDVAEQHDVAVAELLDLDERGRDAVVQVELDRRVPAGRGQAHDRLDASVLTTLIEPIRRVLSEWSTIVTLASVSRNSNTGHGLLALPFAVPLPIESDAVKSMLP